MKCIFISNIVDDSDANFNKVDTVSYADNLVQLQLLRRLNEVYGDNLITITPAYNDYENFKHKEETFYIDDLKVMGIKNNSHNKLIYYLDIMFGYYKKLKYYLNLYKDEKIIVITNGPHIFRTFCIFMTKRKYNYKFIPFVIASVELPEYSFLLRKVTYFSKKVLHLADGSIVLVDEVAKDYTNKPFVQILFSLSPKDIELSNKYYVSNKKSKKNKTILFAGALNDINSIKTVIDVIDRLPDGIKFIICGSGPYQQQLEELAKRKPQKLLFLGKISHEKVIELEHSSDFLYVLRDNKSKSGSMHAKYSTSSKLIEYLLSGTPVIVNNHKAIPKEIRKYLNIIEDNSVDTFLNFITKLDNLTDTDKKAKEGREYIIKNATYRVQGDKVIKFINKF